MRMRKQRLYKQQILMIMTDKDLKEIAITTTANGNIKQF